MANSKKTLNTKTSLIIRLIAGMYLIYLAYELFMGLNASEGAPTALVIGAVVVFCIVGIMLVIIHGKAFLKGEFQGGIMDTSVTEDSVNNE